MNFPWFKRHGLIYLPASIIGGLIAVILFGLIVYAFVWIDRQSHSVSDTLMNFALALVPIGVVYLVIAKFTSHEPNT